MIRLRSTESMLAIVFVAVVGSFLTTQCVVQRRAAEIDSLADRIVSSSTPSIERLDAETAGALASAIKQRMRSTSWIANTLTALSTALGVAGALLIARQARGRRALALAHARGLEARNAELEQFAGRVAHDLRNPIGAMKMAADLALKRGADGALGDLARRVVRGTGRADAIITGLLDFARSGGRPDPGARTDVREVIADLSSGMAQELAGTGIELRVEPVPPVLVGCSKGAYLSLVGNLVRNAMKYMGDKPVRRIEVRVRDEGRMVRTEVADTGAGIAADSLPSLFEPYFQERSRPREGLGLGLATVKKLAEGHHGQAGVSSVAGEGSTFWFLLPRAGTAVESVS